MSLVVLGTLVQLLATIEPSVEPSAEPPATLDTVLPESWKKPRVIIDAGHGAKDNAGTADAFCWREQEHTKVTQDAVAQWLRDRPGVNVRVSRPSKELVSYATRKRAMETWPADAVVSIHSDARAGEAWWRDPASGCLRSRGATGFAVLYSDDGTPTLVAKRRALATALAAAMLVAGFRAYGGEDYPGLYDPVSSGVFVDRHKPGQRIMMLRRTQVPFVIIETHQSLDEAEATMWRQPATHEAFASAIYRAIVTRESPSTASMRSSPDG